MYLDETLQIMESIYNCHVDDGTPVVAATGLAAQAIDPILFAKLKILRSPGPAILRSRVKVLGLGFGFER